MAEILVVDDEKDMLEACTRILTTLGHQPVALPGGVQALDLLASQEFDLVFCDLFMPDIDGMEVLRRISEVAPLTPIVLFTAYGTVDRAVAAMKAGAFDFLEKPFSAQSLQLVLEKGLRQRRLVCERDILKRQLAGRIGFDNIIGRSSAMMKLFDLIEHVASTDANVIITGESGVGKELVAQSVHAHSARGGGAFIPVNCGALPEDIFESELFGYERGAFTGATRRKPGLLECAHGGTFFLDEVCELSEVLQVKLLRVLQDGKLRRLGGDALRDLDVRFVSATNRDVEEAVRAGALREDFYYRLNVVRIHVPPLRERRQDVAQLSEHFLRQCGKSLPSDAATCWPAYAALDAVVPERVLRMPAGSRADLSFGSVWKDGMWTAEIARDLDTNSDDDVAFDVSKSYTFGVAEFDNVRHGYQHRTSAMYSLRFDLAVSVKGSDGLLPTAFSLSQNYPNPFNPATKIAYEVTRPAHVTIRVFNMLGQQVATLVDQQMQPGSYTVDWRTDDLSSGVYYYLMRAGEFSSVRKAILLK